MLIGSFGLEIDGQGRVKIPQAWWKELAGGAVITRGIERCIWIYPYGEFLELVEKMANNLAFTARDARNLFRLLYAQARLEGLDEKGRLSIPNSLREYAGLGEKGVMVGLDRRAEFWEERKWRELEGEILSQAADLGERLSGG
ncbi:MAG: hypothetical protein HYX86_03170 [Chloroflexi bacterium]|nr:hypothetical protein [Chloroflexota bacterium]